MSDPKDIDYCALADELEIPGIAFVEGDNRGRRDVARLLIIHSQAEILTWAMKLCFTGQTPAMIRRCLHNKLVEISGEGERA